MCDQRRYTITMNAVQKVKLLTWFWKKITKLWSITKIFIMLILVPVRCDELTEHIAVTCVKAQNARLNRWQLVLI